MLKQTLAVLFDPLDMHLLTVDEEETAAPSVSPEEDANLKFLEVKSIIEKELNDGLTVEEKLN